MADANLQMSFQPRFDTLAAVRQELRSWLEDRPAPAGVVDELVLAAEELCTNAIEAADGGLVELDARFDGSAVHLAVSNAGHAPEDLSRQAHEPGLMLDRGRGLAIVRALTDSLAIVNVDGRTVARAVRLIA
jgi:anti-sigma regulatory factor (Ser/Thr protein kinase)